MKDQKPNKGYISECKLLTELGFIFVNWVFVVATRKHVDVSRGCPKGSPVADVTVSRAGVTVSKTSSGNDVKSPGDTTTDI